MKYKITLDDLRLIGIGFIPAIASLYVVYYSTKIYDSFEIKYLCEYGYFVY